MTKDGTVGRRFETKMTKGTWRKGGVRWREMGGIGVIECTSRAPKGYIEKPKQLYISYIKGWKHLGRLHGSARPK
jgi:hypothetical protein